MIVTRRNITKITSVFVILAAALTAAGWLFNITALYSTVPGLASMKLITAICFIFTGIAVYASDSSSIKGFAHQLAFICSIIVLLIGVLSLAEHIAGQDIIITPLLRKDGQVDTDPLLTPRMSITTAVIFILISLVLLLLRKKKFHYAAQVVLIIVLIIAIFTILGNIIREDYLQGGFVTYYRMAFNAGLVFTVLCAGIYYSYPLRYLKFSFQKKVTGYLSLFAFFLIIIFFVFFANNRRFIDTARLLDHTNTVLMQSQQLLSRVQDMETGRRGYIITKKEEFLEPYNQAVPKLRESVSELKKITADNPAQQLRMDTLSRLINAKILLDSRMIGLQKDNRDDLSKYISEEVEGKKLMDSIRLVVASVQKEENTLLQKRRTENASNSGNTYRFTILVLVLFLIMLVAVFFIIYNNTRRRNKAETELQQSHEELLKEILERQKLQERLRQFNEQLEGEVKIKTAELTGIFERITDGFIALDKDFCYTYINKRTGEMTGRDPQALIGKCIWDEFPDIVGSDTYKAFTTAMAEQRYINNIDYYAPLDLWQENHIYPSPEGLSIFVRDITKQKKSEKQLAQTMEKVKESEQKYRTIFYKSPLPKWIYDYETLRFLEVNEAAIRHYGYSEKEFLQMTIKEIRPREDVPILMDDLKGAQTGDGTRHGHWRHLKKNGEIIVVETTAHSIEYNNRQARLVVANDITELKKAEEAIKEERTLLRQLIDNLPVYIYLKNNDSRYVICNRALVELAGVDSEKDAIGKRVEDLFGPEIGPVNLEEDKRAFELGETALNREESILTPAGERRWLLTSKVPLKDEKNRVKALIGISLDVTEQRQTALLMEQLNERLKKRAIELSASNTELERFAYVASHDLQEPLRMVSSFLQLLEKKLDGQLDDASKQYIHFAVDGAERMKKLIQDLLQYSRLGTTTESDSEVNCNEVMTAVQNVFELSIHERKAKITVGSLPVIRGVKTQIQQLFQNLVGNALKYSGDRPPHIEVGCTDAGDYWRFYVKDNGIGIESKYFEKIFIIFQRLHNKNEYSGTGIGLAICKKIAERHNGKISVESELGKGTTFFIELPK